MSTCLIEFDTGPSLSQRIHPVVRSTSQAALQAHGEPHPINVLDISNGDVLLTATMSPITRSPPHLLSLEIPNNNVQPTQVTQEPMPYLNITSNTDQEHYKELVNCEYSTAEVGSS